MQRVALATRSTHKAAEIREILHTANLQLVSLADLGIAESAAEETIENAETFTANAVAKARYFAELTGLPTIADDSGLEVDALGKRPGVRTRRFAIDHGYTGPGGLALDQANLNLLLEHLRDVPDRERAARYVCAAALANPAGARRSHAGEKLITTIGTCAGSITRAPRGTGGFGYDPIFLLPDLNLTFAELSREQKNARSHRARAFRALAAFL